MVAWTCLHPGTLGEIGQHRTWTPITPKATGQLASFIHLSALAAVCLGVQCQWLQSKGRRSFGIHGRAPWKTSGTGHWWHQCCATTKLERYRLRSVKSRWKQILSTEVVVQYADECSWSCILWNQKKCLEIKPPNFFHDHRVLFFLVDRSALIIGNLFFRSYLQVRSCRKGGGTRTSLLPGFAGFTWKGL